MKYIKYVYSVVLVQRNPDIVIEINYNSILGPSRTGSARERPHDRRRAYMPMQNIA